MAEKDGTEKKRVHQEAEAAEEKKKRLKQQPPGSVSFDASTAAVLSQFPSLTNLKPPVQLIKSDEPSRCLVLKNIFDPAPKAESKYYKCIRDKIHQKCGEYGAVHHIYTDKNDGSVYLKFDSIKTATRAKKELHQTMYEKRCITANFMDAPYFLLILDDLMLPAHLQNWWPALSRRSPVVHT